MLKYKANVPASSYHDEAQANICLSWSSDCGFSLDKPALTQSKSNDNKVRKIVSTTCSAGEGGFAMCLPPNYKNNSSS